MGGGERLFGGVCVGVDDLNYVCGKFETASTWRFFTFGSGEFIFILSGWYYEVMLVLFIVVVSYWW